MASAKTEKRLMHALRDFIHEAITPREPQEKRVKTPYMFFCCERRQEISDALAKLDGGDAQRVRAANVTRKLAELWSKMTEEEKAVYVQRSTEERERRKQLASETTAPAVEESKTNNDPSV